MGIHYNNYYICAHDAGREGSRLSSAITELLAVRESVRYLHGSQVVGESINSLGVLCG